MRGPRAAAREGGGGLMGSREREGGVVPFKFGISQ